MQFLDPALDEYSENHSTPESSVLAELNRDTQAHVLIPRMLSGHLQGRVLAMLSKLQRPNRILEIGTYTGYSALCLAEGLTDNGVLHTIDINEELESMVNRYVEKAGMRDKIVQHIGNAMDIVPKLKEQWDLVFIDADKENYLNYYKMIIDELPSGAIIIGDNVLWSGKVLKAADPKDEETRMLQEFNDFVQADERVENVLMPIRDGLMVIRKR